MVNGFVLPLGISSFAETTTDLVPDIASYLTMSMPPSFMFFSSSSLVECKSIKIIFALKNYDTERNIFKQIKAT